jgi:hypothetical protein
LPTPWIDCFTFSEGAFTTVNAGFPAIYRAWLDKCAALCSNYAAAPADAIDELNRRGALARDFAAPPWR